MANGQSRLPTFIEPQIPALSAEPPTGVGWLHEIKYDGFRTLLRIDGKDIRASTRNGQDCTDKYRYIIAAAADLNCGSALIDGEVVVLDEKGISDFSVLRAAIDHQPHRLVLFAFDLLFLNGRDWRREPLIERRARLDALIPNDSSSAIQFSDHYDGEGADLYKGACDIGLEGIVSKRANAPYRSGQSPFWLKIKVAVESELVLLGTDYDSEGKRIAYLGKEEEGQLKLAGTAVMTLSALARYDLDSRIQKLVTERPPIPQCIWRQPRWLKPELRVRVKHLAGGDRLKHASVQGLANSWTRAPLCLSGRSFNSPLRLLNPHRANSD
jgi:DNA ligase D-like protein (predicted ligase)